MEAAAKIAVIVPVYNAGKFLPELLDCLMRQTMKDFAVYFVDDCSMDDTAALLLDAVKENKFFHYMRNDKRCGAAISRNRGIAVSRSEYVVCLDADDLIADDFLEQLIEAADFYHADMVMLEREDFTAFDRIRRKKTLLKDDKELFEKDIFNIREQPIDFLIRCQNATYDRMVARELLDRFQIQFQDLPSSNDVFFILFSTFAAENIVHTRTADVLYYRRLHSEPDRISNDRDPMCAFEALHAVKKALMQYHMWEERCVHFWIFALDSLEKQLFVCKREERQKQVYQYLQEAGLRELGVPGDPFYYRLPECYRKQFERFYQTAFEEKCFRDSMSFQALCESNLKKIADIFLYVKREGLQIGYWGAGRSTEGFISSAASIGEKVDYLIDNSKDKQGKKMFGLEVVSYDSVSEQIEFMIISNKQYYHEIFRQIKTVRKDVRVLCIQEYLYSKSTLKECIQ